MRRLTALSIILASAVAVAPVHAQDSAFTLTSTDVKNGAFSPAQIFNGFPISAFAQNVGMVALTGIKSRYVVAAGGGSSCCSACCRYSGES